MMLRGNFSLCDVGSPFWPEGHGLFFSGMDPGIAIELRIEMFPGLQQMNRVGSDFTFREKQGEDFGSNRAIPGLNKSAV
jgi:hypothetical protein